MVVASAVRDVRGDYPTRTAGTTDLAYRLRSLVRGVMIRDDAVVHLRGRGLRRLGSVGAVTASAATVTALGSTAAVPAVAAEV